MAPLEGSLKVVTDPICGVIDIGSVLPMVETPEFQALADKRQLGMTYLVFRSAMHTRFSHCLGAYHATGALADRWLLRGFINRTERTALAAYALYHDIGHPAFSHVTEDFCALDDDEMSLLLIQKRLKSAIEACGVDHALMVSLANHQNPLYLAVHDKNVGMEKLDYLERDGFYTTLSRPPGVAYLRNYLYFIDGKVAIDEKVVEHAIDAQIFYMKMYKGVYLRKSLVIAQRMFHKIVYHLILAGELSSENLPHMTDSELLGMMFFSRDPIAQILYGFLRERNLFREAIVIRPEQFAHETRINDKPITVFGIPQTEMNQLVASPALQKKNHPQMEDLEDKIADVVGIPRGDVLVVPVFNPERFQAKDITIYGSDKKLHSLRERRPAHFAGMEETARSYSALRICTRPEYRKLLSGQSPARMLDLILSTSKIT